jgi:two-component system response regulator AdeR
VGIQSRKASRRRLRNVLLIEDDPSIRDAIVASLEEIGARDVAIADDGRSGLAMIDTLRPSVVLLDLMLPVADGYDVLAEIRRRPADSRPRRVVVVSGLGDSRSAQALLKLGADRVLPKPFTLSEFEAAVSD